MSLKVVNIHKAYKKVQALKSLSFELDAGASVALLGPNGAGKSTAIKILVSLLRPDEGGYHWNGEDLFAKPARIRELVGYVSQEMAMDKQLTGAEFIRFCAGLQHLDWKAHSERAMALLATMGLGDAKDRLVGEYSGGMKRRLDLAVALLNHPKVLVLDEPTSGLDIEAREQIWDLIKDFVAKGGALLLASHDFREVDELAQKVLILKAGEVARYDTPQALKQALGDFIIRIKTQDYMAETMRKSVTTAMASWGSNLVPYDEVDYATFAWRGEDSMALIQKKVYDTLEAAGLPLHSLNIQRPSLEDVYRFSVGGAK